jgi:hypothetical protein
MKILGRPFSNTQRSVKMIHSGLRPGESTNQTLCLQRWRRVKKRKKHRILFAYIVVQRREKGGGGEGRDKMRGRIAPAL